MKAFAMQVWEMPADEFIKTALIFVVVCLLVFETVVEIRSRRVIRLSKKFG